MVSRILCFCMVIVVAYAATGIGPLPTKPKELAHKEGCYVKEINDVIPFDSSVTPLGNCVRIGCSSQLMHYASCGSIGTIGGDPKCYITGTDYSKPYPDCCPTIECEVDNNLI